MATYKNLKSPNGDKLQVESAIRDGAGKNIENNYAKQNGFYSGMGVGKATLADNFDTKMVLTDNSGYLFRTTGGSLEVGNQNRVKKIIGASVPIIQLVQNGNFASSSGWTTNAASFSVSNNVGTLTPSARTGRVMSSDISIISGHKYFVACSIKKSVASEAILCDLNNTGGTPLQFPFPETTDWVRNYYIGQINTSGSYKLRVVDYTNDSWSSTQIKDAQVIDLTATFGTTVANRLYALEQAQAGTGIAKAKEILVKNYYPYNVTAFTHTKTSGKVNTGFNQWKEIYESGTLDLTDGSNVASDSQSRVSLDNAIRVFPSTVYHFYRESTTGTTYICYYDVNKAFISSATLMSSGVGNANFTTPDNAAFIRFVVPNSVASKHICINLHWDGERDGEYEEYQEWSYPTEDKELKGILSLDASDNWVADGDEYLPSGVVDERIVIIPDLSQLDWGKESDHLFYCISNSMPLYLGKRNALCSKYAKASNPTTNPYVDLTWGQSGAGYLEIRDNAYSNATDFKASLAGVWLIGIVATPTSTTADPYTELQNDSNWGTEKWIDNRDVPLPVFSTCEYLPDLKAKEEVAPESPDEDGDYIMHRENGLNSYSSLSTWLSANGYNKMQDISSDIFIDDTYLTVDYLYAYQQGDVVRLKAKLTVVTVPAQGVEIMSIGEAINQGLCVVIVSSGTAKADIIEIDNGGEFDFTNTTIGDEVYIDGTVILS